MEHSLINTCLVTSSNNLQLAWLPYRRIWHFLASSTCFLFIHCSFAHLDISSPRDQSLWLLDCVCVCVYLVCSLLYSLESMQLWNEKVLLPAMSVSKRMFGHQGITLQPPPVVSPEQTHSGSGIPIIKPSPTPKMHPEETQDEKRKQDTGPDS